MTWVVILGGGIWLAAIMAFVSTILHELREISDRLEYLEHVADQQKDGL